MKSVEILVDNQGTVYIVRGDRGPVIAIDRNNNMFEQYGLPMGTNRVYVAVPGSSGTAPGNPFTGLGPRSA